MYTGLKNLAPRVVQPVGNKANFAVTAKFDSVPTDTYQMQGLVLQETLNKFIRFGMYGNSGVQMYFCAMIDTNTANVFFHASTGFAADRLRLERNGDQYTALVGRPGFDEFETLKTFTVNFSSFAVNEAGLYAGNAGGNPAYLASVDWFAVDEDANALSHPSHT